MHLNSHHGVITNLLITFIWILLIARSAPAEERFETAVQQPFSRLLELLANDEDAEISGVLTQWKKHLKAVSTYSQEEYTESLDIIEKEYSDLIAKLELCMGNPQSVQKIYDSKWVDKLVAHFGVSYLKDKEKSIVINLRMVAAGDTENCCGPVLEKLCFKEAVLYGAYRYYVNTFLEFCKEQPLSSSEVIEQRKNAAEDFLKLIDRISITKVTIGSGMPKRLLSEIAARNYDKDIYEWFSDNPIGCDIDAFKVLEDFRKAIGKTEKSP